MQPLIGVMQGRLLPSLDGRIQGFPVDVWPTEFSFATQACLSYIEWIYEAPNSDQNPISSSSGIDQIKKVSVSNGIDILSVCADYFMDNRLAKDDGSLNQSSVDMMYWLLERTSILGAKYMVLPFVDNSSMTRIRNHSNLVELLNTCSQFLREIEVQLHLEIDLPPKQIKSLLSQIENPMIKIVFDIGNSASLGYNPIEELDSIGSNLGSVHIKDRTLGGSTVPLGQGDANFSTIFEQLISRNYKGSYTLQVARDSSLSEIELAKRNVQFVKSYFS